jgi:hypothetical protein
LLGPADGAVNDGGGAQVHGAVKDHDHANVNVTCTAKIAGAITITAAATIV